MFLCCILKNLTSPAVFLDKNKYFEGKKPLIIPHRGGRNIVPENTLHALENTVRSNFTHFETDLRMSRDGIVFLHHDPTLDRTTHTKGYVSNIEWDDLKKINAGSKFYEKNGLDMKTSFISLRDALGTFEDLFFNLDLKQGGMAEKVYKIIKETKSEERTLVSSFSPLRLDNFYRISKGEILTSGSFRENVIARFLSVKERKFKVNALQAPFIWKGIKVHSKKLRDFCNINNLYLHIWTVNTVSEFESCLNFGCDGIITDEPIKLREYIENLS